MQRVPASAHRRGSPVRWGSFAKAARVGRSSRNFDPCFDILVWQAFRADRLYPYAREIDADARWSGRAGRARCSSTLELIASQRCEHTVNECAARTPSNLCDCSWSLNSRRPSAYNDRTSFTTVRDAFLSDLVKRITDQHCGWHDE